MSRVVRELYDKASGLPAQDRAELAGLLLESLEQGRDEGVEEAWTKSAGKHVVPRLDQAIDCD